MSTRPAHVSVTDPIAPAIDRAKLILFQPFDLTKWLLIGVCAWLAGLGEGGAGGGGFNWRAGRHDADDFRASVEGVRGYFLENLHWIIPLGIALLVIGLAIWVVMVWLSSRGRFMFLDNVVLNRAEIGGPWTLYRTHADSLFVFRLVLGLLGFVVVLPLVLVAAALLLPMILHGHPSLGPVLGVAGLGLAVIAVSVAFALVAKFTNDFVVPVMYLGTPRVMDAWRRFMDLLADNAGRFVIYILFHIVISIAIGLLVVAVVLLTCCVAGCLLAIPFLGTVLLLPILIFKRSYSAYYLAQYGPEYNVFASRSA